MKVIYVRASSDNQDISHQERTMREWFKALTDAVQRHQGHVIEKVVREKSDQT